MTPTILVLDDFASVRLYHMSFLKRKGYDCLGAASSVEALALLKTQRVDLILLDMVMPGMDGGQFLALLNANPHHAQIPVLAITSEESLAHTAAAGGTRPFGVQSKPVMPDTLLQHVQRLVAPAATVASPPA